MPVPNNQAGWAAVVALFVVAAGCASLRLVNDDAPPVAPTAPRLTARQDPSGNIEILKQGAPRPVVTQVARPDERPYLHPIAAPDGNGTLTEDSPAHHPHQSGLYWGFTRLNGRDFFHNRKGDYWRRVSAAVLEAGATGSAENAVRWQTVYDLLGADGSTLLTETQRWTMRERAGAFVLDLEWKGEARADLTIGRYDYGGLFLRMPWRQGIAGEVVNAARQRNERAEGQRAMWIDVGLAVEGRSDLAHIAIFDHPGNPGYPQQWRVDEQLGVGSARARIGDSTIRKGAAEVIRHQFLIYTGALDDVVVTQAWAAFAGNRSPYSTQALWAVAQREGREAPFLTPDQAVARMTVVDGYQVTAWANEPMVTQPMAFCWDDRGRLWVAENRDYESRVRGFSNAGDSRILILEDTNRDGIADSRKVFMEGIAFPAALAVGFGGVFVGAPPNLLFVPDKNGDDKADLDAIEVRLTGWGIQDRHETLNSLHWGPDGWLYGLQGYATSSKIRKPAGRGRIYRHKDPFPDDLLTGDGVEINGGVWRYHPTRDVFEVVAHGFSNPWGIDYDAKGQLLISACVIPHLWHVVPGGIYHRQGGQHFNPYVYDDIKTIADHRHRSAHGGARVYQSDAFPASQQGRIFMANIHEHAVLSDVLERRGSGFTARHGDDFLLANNAHWIGFSVEIGPDGALYVLDWHDGDICGQDILHQETGRVYRIAPKQSLAADFNGRYGDLRQMDDAALVQLQTSRSDWHARRARVILQHRAATGALNNGTHAALRAIFGSHENADYRLRAMWALHVTGGWTADALTDALADRDEHVRAWAVQLLTEDRRAPQRALDAFARLARDDKSPVVRLYLASALQRIDRGARWPIAAALMAHGEDAADHNLPKMLWLAVEPLVAAEPRIALDHASRSAIPLVARFTARRTVDLGTTAALDAVVAAIATAPAAQTSLLEGLRDGLEGRYDVTAPAGWAAVHTRLKRAEPRVVALARDISQQFGDTEAARRNLATVKNRRAPIEERRRALRTLAGQRRPELIAELPAAVDDRSLRIEGIRAVAAFDDNSLGRLLVDRYNTFSAAEKTEALQTLASRPRYGRMLAEAIVKDIVPRTDIPASMPRQLLRVVGTKFLEVWGPVERSAVEEQAYAKYRTLLDDEALRGANILNGHAVYLRTCGACHKLHGDGATLGPDLTGSNRSSLDYLLLNVLNPNAEVADAYRMVVVTTRDGRTYSGTVAVDTDRQLTLRVIGRDAVTIAKADIQSREATTTSMMPPGLFDAMSDREVIDLVAYLRTLEPVK
jgi:putative membrane-bound dehydrogenase-like protein